MKDDFNKKNSTKKIKNKRVVAPLRVTLFQTRRDRKVALNPVEKVPIPLPPTPAPSTYSYILSLKSVIHCILYS